ncbi:sin3 histone deacetylase corepressor complex component SDS3 [Aphelenchoides avenae]|nr:sin3 histone deacetylase corepressor complex component SDS3 [Aphelenchus avenae]
MLASSIPGATGESTERDKDGGDLLDEIAARKLGPLIAEEEDLKSGTHAQYLAGIEKLRQEYERDLETIDITEQASDSQNYEKDRIQKAYETEKAAIAAEYETRISELVETLYNECDEKKRLVEQEVNSLDIASNTATAANFYYCQANKKTLRRRANEQSEVSEKRPRKHSPQHIVHLLPDAVIAHDVKLICNKNPYSIALAADDEDRHRKVTVDSNRLICDGKTFHRGQNVMCETVNYGKFPAIIQSMCEQFVQLRSTVPGDTRQVTATKDDLECGRVVVRKKY